jgi:ATP-dependent Clp protease, protease subunit
MLNMASSSLAEFDVDEILSKEAIHTLFGAVDEQSAEAAIRFILAHNCASKKKFITLIVNSEGGDLNHAFALIDIITHSKIPVHTLGLGQISSSGLMIFMAGAKGHRTLTANTSIMSHQWSGNFEGKIHELMSAQMDIRLTQQRILAHYERYSTLTVKEIEQHLLPAHDVFLSAEQAVQMGLADRIQI